MGVEDFVYARKPNTLVEFNRFFEGVSTDIDNNRQLCGAICAGDPEGRIV